MFALQGDSGSPLIYNRINPGDELNGTWELIGELDLSSLYIQADETTLQVCRGWTVAFVRRVGCEMGLMF